MKAEYKRDNYHLTKSREPKEKSLFIPQLLELCEGLMTLDPNERLGVKGGWDSLKGHTFFAGFNWAALRAGAMTPPITPSHSEINADVPEKLKDEFQSWAEKPVPEAAPALFATWTGVTKHVVESTAVSQLDKKGVYFDPPDTPEDKALTRKGLWSELVKPPESACAVAPEAVHVEAKAGGCCVLL